MINSVKLEHFKAFKEPSEIVLDGKNVLVFGENGAGKSSLYQALKIIFHRKEMFQREGFTAITDLHDREIAENNYLEKFNHQKTPLDNYAITINNVDYKSFSIAGYDVSMISQEDITVEDTIDVGKLLSNTLVGIDKPGDFIRDKKQTIETLVNSFLEEYFYEASLKVELSYKDPDWMLTIKDSSRDDLARNEELTNYYNEAKLHIVKLLVLLTAVLYNGAKERGDIPVLVLDDVITSMDAANRTFFVELLKEYFGDYQMVIMTHSVSFFNMADYAFNFAYGQKDKWKQFQIVEHEGNSEIVERSSQDYAANINGEYKYRKKTGQPLDPIGNRIRERFEFLVCEVSKLLYTGGIAESGRLIEAINTPKKLYYEFDGTKTKTVYDLIEELTTIIDADAGSPLKTQLQTVIDRYVSDTEVAKLRDTICDLAVYQKVSMHPLSHATGPVPMTAPKEIERSITLLMLLEKQIGTLIGRDLYSI